MACSPTAGVTVEFTAADYTVRENEGSVSVTIVKEETSERDVQVEFVTEDGTAGGEPI